MDAFMSYFRKEGKDEIRFVTKEDHEAPIKIDIKNDDEDEQPGILLPNGEINWNCPCLEGKITGPCGVEFRELFSCFHYSKAERKGSDCFDQFRTMKECEKKYPAVYPDANDILDMGEEEGEDSESAQNQAKVEKSTEKKDSDDKDPNSEASKSE